MTARLPNMAIVFRMCVFCLALAAGQATARDYFVDQKHPDASDKNPGTKAQPFKTIQAGLDQAQPGDSVLVRAGSYHESPKFTHSGNSGGAAWNDPENANWITLEPYKGEHVMLDGSLTVPARDWKLVEGGANTYVAPFEAKGLNESFRNVQMVFADDVMIPPALRDLNDKTRPGLPKVPAMPGDKTSDEGWYYDVGQNKLFVNLGGRVPGKSVEVAAAQLDFGVDMSRQSYVRLRKMEIRRFNQRGLFTDNAHDFVVEDNYVHHCGTGLWSGRSSGGIIRGNTFSDIFTIAMNVGDSRGTIIEGNLIKRFHVNPFKINSAYSYSAAIMCNCSFGLVANNNIITEGDVDGIWPDCGSIGIALYGNAIYGLPINGGFYIEADAHGTVLQWNAVFDNLNGIAFRGNTANTALENYVFNNRGIGLTIGSCDAIGVRADTMMYNWVVGNGAGAGFGPNSLKTPAHAFDHNVYCRNGLLFGFGDKQYKDIQSVRENVGVEMHGEEVKDFDPTPLGLVTFRVHDTKESWKPVPMFGNPGTRRVDVPNSFELYFWKKGTFLRPEPYGWRAFGRLFGRTRGEANGFLRQLPVSVIPFAQNDPELKNKVNSSVDDPSACWTNGLCLQVCAIPGKSLSAEGLGFWSPNLPTTDEAQIDLSLWIRAKGIKPAGENGGVYAVAEFCDETGQDIKRQYLVGANDGRKVVGEEWTQGTYEYQKVSGTVTAPKGARWFKMAFGIRNCSGWAAFNSFDIHTRPGEKTKVAGGVLPINAKRYAWTPCDLTGLLNRPLADEVDGDGKGGWTDQGPTSDLRNLYPGDYTYNGAAFRVAKGNACFIMKNKHRPSENLPAGGKVELQGKADVLAFLHSGAWIEQGVRQATYVIHYADGTKVEIPVIGGKNILDWTAAANRADALRYDPALGLLLPATSVPSPQFVHVTVWMLLWKNQYPDKQIVSLEVKGADEGIPGLIAVSAGRAKP